jgi:hypothetical protein
VDGKFLLTAALSYCRLDIFFHIIHQLCRPLIIYLGTTPKLKVLQELTHVMIFPITDAAINPFVFWYVYVCCEIIVLIIFAHELSDIIRRRPSLALSTFKMIECAWQRRETFVTEKTRNTTRSMAVAMSI